MPLPLASSEGARGLGPPACSTGGSHRPAMAPGQAPRPPGHPGASVEPDAAQVWRARAHAQAQEPQRAGAHVGRPSGLLLGAGAARPVLPPPCCAAVVPRVTRLTPEEHHRPQENEARAKLSAGCAPQSPFVSNGDDETWVRCKRGIIAGSRSCGDTFESHPHVQSVGETSVEPQI